MKHKLFWWSYYYGNNESTRKEIGKNAPLCTVQSSESNIERRLHFHCDIWRLPYIFSIYFICNVNCTIHLPCVTAYFESTALASQYIDQDSKLLLVLVRSIPSWLVLAEIKRAVHVTLSKCPIHHFKAVQKTRQQVLRAYCPDIYTVTGLYYQLRNDDSLP